MPIFGRFPAIDAAHLTLMLTALLLAYVLPFQLVLLAYAVLGPAHYMTEISWLHERSYFLPRRSLAVILVVLTGCLVMAVTYEVSTVYIVLIVWAALIYSLAFGIFKKIEPQFLIIAVGFYAGLWVMRRDPQLGLLVFLLPTLVHVSVFTFIFMLVGALRSKSPFQFLLVAVYLIGLAVILAWPPIVTTQPENMRLLVKYFGQVGDALGLLFSSDKWPLTARLAGVLSFVYTYHYLNWFIKVKVINWHTVPKWRLCVIAGLSLAATATYFYDYILGFTVLLGLSLLHVMLELPLNMISIRQLGGFLKPRRLAK